MSPKVKKIIFQAIGFLFVIALAIYLTQLVRENDSIQTMIASYGYFGVFLVGFISGFNFVIPVPAASFLPVFVESGLAYWPAILLITFGMTLADTIAYFLGGMGREAVGHTLGEKTMRKLLQIQKRFPWAPLGILLIFAAVVPLPNEVLLISFGFLGYRLIHILPILLLGNLIFNILYAKGLFSILSLT